MSKKENAEINFPKYGIRVGPFRLNQHYYIKFQKLLEKKKGTRMNNTSLFKLMIDASEKNIKRPFTIEELKMFKALMGMANNLNQITKSLNSFRNKPSLNNLEVQIIQHKIALLIQMINECADKFIK